MEILLRFMARTLLVKYHPFIVGITGSVGKSSAKEAVALVLSRSFSVRKAEGNYNNEIGIPLTIIGAKSGEASLLRWVGVFGQWFRALLFPIKYPDILVLEIGIDRPGDMERLLNIVPVKIGVVTHISSSHMEFFGSLANIAKEKGKLVSCLPADGFAILNGDDKRVLKMREKTKAKIITYGFGEDVMLRVDNLLFHRDAKRVEGFSFKLNYDGKTIPVRVPKIVARHHISSALVAAAVGMVLKMNLVEIASALEGFEPMPGRMRLLPGRNALVLLDDTYNASPSSTEAALQVVGEFMAPRKVVILGDMLELGADTAEEHGKLSEAVVASGAHIVVLVGWHMRSLYEKLLLLGFSRKYLFSVSDAAAAIGLITSLARTEDLILVKGSQGMRMEKVVEALLVDPYDAKELLCRQTDEWRSKPFVPPAEWSGVDF